MTAPIPQHVALPLVEVERQLRAPRPPEELVDALQDRIHPTSGRLLAMKPVFLPCPHGWHPKDCGLCGGQR
jgi:hypothetical protein